MAISARPIGRSIHDSGAAGQSKPRDRRIGGRRAALGGDPFGRRADLIQLDPGLYRGLADSAPGQRLGRQPKRILSSRSASSLPSTAHGTPSFAASPPGRRRKPGKPCGQAEHGLRGTSRTPLRTPRDLSSTDPGAPAPLLRRAGRPRAPRRGRTDPIGPGAIPGNRSSPARATSSPG